MNSVKISKIYKTESPVPPKPEVTWKLTWIIEVSRNVNNGFLDLENINSEEIVKIHEIQSSVLLRYP